MDYQREFLPAQGIPRAAHPLFQHLLETYVSETNKTASVWSELRDEQLAFRLHEKSSTVREILTHQILSERRFFAEFMGFPEPAAATLLPGTDAAVTTYIARYVELAGARLSSLASGDEAFWLTHVPFFDVTRERIWVFWRRVLHTSHHRAQVGVCLRLVAGQVPPTYGPTADVTWAAADPTRTVAAAQRRV